jgi:hypothetical protein
VSLGKLPDISIEVNGVVSTGKKKEWLIWNVLRLYERIIFFQMIPRRYCDRYRIYEC